MSHQVVIDYSGITIKTAAQCDIAVVSLCKIDKVIENVHKNASKFENEKLIEYENYLTNAKNKLKTQIEDMQQTLEKYKNYKSHDENAYRQYQQKVIAKANSLVEFASNLTGSKLAVIDQMINEGLFNVARTLKNKVDGVIEVNGELTNQINNIEDVSLRELAMLEATKDNNVNFDTILIRAQNKYDELLGKKQQEVITGYKEELAKKGIDSDVIKDTDSIDEATNKYNEALIDESVRKEILTIIVKTIRKRGFIVNKNNIKLDKNLNLVRLVALKASGQKAEFEIQLNGKFMYRFDNYEGQACKKDITPFIEDLKNIYDINILHEEVIWENPDKIQMQKYQHVNTNKGNN